MFCSARCTDRLWAQTTSYPMGNGGSAQLTASPMDLHGWCLPQSYHSYTSPRDVSYLTTVSKNRVLVVSSVVLTTFSDNTNVHNADSSVRTVTSLRTVTPRNQHSIPGRCKRFFLSPKRPDPSGASPASYPNGYCLLYNVGQATKP